jgi:hypothetical protein
MSRFSPSSNDWQAGESLVADQLLPLAHNDLRRFAAQSLAHEQPGQMLDGTALVHEAYSLFANSAIVRTISVRQHLFRAAATPMRRIFIDRARRKRAHKHRGGLRRCPLESVAACSQSSKGTTRGIASLRWADRRAGRGDTWHIGGDDRPLACLRSRLAAKRSPRSRRFCPKSSSPPVFRGRGELMRQVLSSSVTKGDK